MVECDFFGFDLEIVKTLGIVFYTVFTGVIMALIAWQSFLLNKQVKISARQSKPIFDAKEKGKPIHHKETPEGKNAYQYSVYNYGARISDVKIKGVGCSVLSPNERFKWLKDICVHIIIDAGPDGAGTVQGTKKFRVEISYLDAIGLPDKEKVVVGVTSDNSFKLSEWKRLFRLRGG